MQYNTVVVMAATVRRRGNERDSGRHHRHRPVGVQGAARRRQLSRAGARRRHPRLRTTQRELSRHQAVVYSLAPDALLGIGNAERLGVDAVGARNKRFMRINTGGATGLSSVAVGHAHIASGACDRRAGRGRRQGGRERRFADDPQQDLGSDLRARSCRSAPSPCSRCRRCGRWKNTGMTEEDMARVTVKNRAQRGAQPEGAPAQDRQHRGRARLALHRWPIKLLDACPQSSGGAAMVLACEKYIKENRLDAVWITGVAIAPRATTSAIAWATTFVADHADAHALRNRSSARTAWRESPTRRSRCTSPSCTRRSPTPSSTRSRRPGCAGSAIDGDVARGRVPSRRHDSDQSVGRNAVHQRHRGIRDGAGRRSRAAGLGPCRRPPAAKGAKVAIASGNGGDHQFFGTMVIESVTNRRETQWN